MKKIEQMEKISVIVPIYNVQNYLEECINSILKQDYENIEIILIDDGSTDKSGIICDKYKKKYNSIIKVFHKKNGGLSDARNYGIRHATGRYIAFVDGDDIVLSDYLSSMYNNLKKSNVLVSACGFVKYFDDGTINEINFKNIEKKYDKYDAQKYLNIIGYFNVSACNKLFDIKLFDDIIFPVGKKSEDWFVMYKLLYKAGEIYYSSIPKYYYRQRYGSITKNSVINYDCIEAAKEVLNFYEINMPEIIQYGVQSFVFSAIGVYNTILIRMNKKTELKALKNQIYNEKKRFTYSSLSIARKIQVFLFFNALPIYNFTFKMFNLIRKKEGKYEK